MRSRTISGRFLSDPSLPVVAAHGQIDLLYGGSGPRNSASFAKLSAWRRGLEGIAMLLMPGIKLDRNGELFYAVVGTEGAVVGWELLEGPRKIAEFCAARSDKFGVNRQTCEVEVLKFVVHLIGSGVVHEDAAQA